MGSARGRQPTSKPGPPETGQEHQSDISHAGFPRLLGSQNLSGVSGQVAVWCRTPSGHSWPALNGPTGPKQEATPTFMRDFLCTMVSLIRNEKVNYLISHVLHNNTSITSRLSMQQWSPDALMELKDSYCHVTSQPSYCFLKRVPPLEEPQAGHLGAVPEAGVATIAGGSSRHVTARGGLPVG